MQTVINHSLLSQLVLSSFFFILYFDFSIFTHHPSYFEISDETRSIKISTFPVAGKIIKKKESRIFLNLVCNEGESTVQINIADDSNEKKRGETRKISSSKRINQRKKKIRSPTSKSRKFESTRAIYNAKERTFENRSVKRG